MFLSLQYLLDRINYFLNRLVLGFEAYPVDHQPGTDITDLLKDHQPFSLRVRPLSTISTI